MKRLHNPTNFVLHVVLAALATVSLASAHAGVIADGAAPVKVVEGLSFGEGPTADAQGNIFFTDVMKQQIRHYTVADGKCAVVYEKTGGANGLHVDAAGNLYACEMRNRRVTKRSPTGELSVVTDVWEGKKFNQPNDLWVDPKGGVYFTDPAYVAVQGEKEMDGEHVYYVKPGGGTVRVSEGPMRPNGIMGTADGKTLYVAENVSNTIRRYDIGADGTLSNPKAVVNRGSDGMTLDEQGNIYVTGEKILQIYTADGALLETVPFPGQTTNCTFGGAERKTLYVTCTSGLYSLAMTVKGL